MLVGEDYDLNLNGVFSSQSGFYKLTGIVAGDALMDMGIDVKTSVFTDVGLTDTDYEQWLTSDKNIYTFKSADVTLKIPTGFFTVIGQVNPVEYRKHLVSINLGELSVDESLLLGDLKDRLKREVVDLLGIEVTIAIDSYGKPIIISEVDHQSAITTRQARITAQRDSEVSRETLIAENQILNFKIAEYEAIIKAKVLA